MLAAALCLLAAAGHAAEIVFNGIQLPTELGVGYAVRLIDMNDDGRLDIAVVDKTRILWLENPTWREHVILEGQTRPDNVCFAPNDIDGDGKLDFALGADWTLNTKEGGQIAWIEQNEKPGRPWTLHPIGEEPTVHRMRWADLDGDDRKELVVAPLFGRGTTRPNFAERGVRLLSFAIPQNPAVGPWQPTVLNDDLHVVHNFMPADLNGDGQLEVLVASFEGVSLLERSGDAAWRRTLIGEGNQQTSPNRGASEVKHGRLAGGADYIATIEPWHGHQVVVYTRPEGERTESGDWLWKRQVLDEELKWGHAVWCANLDNDEDQELIIGVRDNKDEQHRCGVRIYDPQDNRGEKWTRQLVDPGSVAVEDLVAGDVNNDGRVDIVAVGRQTHNAKIYFNETPKAKPAANNAK
ncbi:MAG: VCBS repeat-containing protein [Planctomycetes bacterium]|nr:VCBS repeat-containing protein [Planctomycetota bacterium]